MPYSVTTKCPSCGGEMQFDMGSNAVRCGFCGSQHLVTGHGRVLSYYIPEKIDIKQAAQAVRVALRESGRSGWRVADANLFFIPYFRYTAQVLKWEVRTFAVNPLDTDMLNYEASIGLWGAAGSMSSEYGSGASQITETRYNIAGRLIDRTILAMDAPELKMPSLGLRPGVLALNLFSEGELEKRGIRAPVTKDALTLDATGFAPVSPANLYIRSVVAKCRSLIFFPFWLVEITKGASRKELGERGMAVVDAVSGNVSNLDAKAALVDRIIGKTGRSFETAGFRPLKCPNCAADLPLRTTDVVFFCNNCARAWYIKGTDFVKMKYTVAKPVEPGSGEPVYLPFWNVSATLTNGNLRIETRKQFLDLTPGTRYLHKGSDDGPFRLIMPAFRMRSMTLLSRLAAAFTRFQPDFEHGEHGVDVKVEKGSFLTPEDTVELARTVLMEALPEGVEHRLLEMVAGADVEHTGSELLLIPFYRISASEYVDGILGQTLPVATTKD